ncbi:MAG: hypothetical protein JNJ89_13200 [Rubrivivax sp.]|nr:hypothetical protein [Rubrivivax sp.]
MSLPSEALLAALIIGLYLKDSLLLLAPDEAVLVRGLGGHWHAGFGARGYKLAGREPYLANPLTPHAPVVRLRWRMTGPAPDPGVAGEGAAADGAGAAALRLVPVPLARLAPFAWASWLLLFGLIPAAVLAQWGVTFVLWALAALYASIAAALAMLWPLRGPLGLSQRAYALLAFECLVCPPYAANIVRRAAAARTVPDDFVALAGQLLPAAARAQVRRECLARIDEQLEAFDEGDAAAEQLRRARVHFAAGSADEQDPTTG